MLYFTGWMCDYIFVVCVCVGGCVRLRACMCVCVCVCTDVYICDYEASIKLSPNFTGSDSFPESDVTPLRTHTLHLTPVSKLEIYIY